MMNVIKGISDLERKTISDNIITAINELHPTIEGWIDLAKIGKRLNVNYRKYGYLKLGYMLNEFDDIVELKYETVDDKPPVCYVRLKNSDTSLSDHELNDSNIADSNTSDIHKPTWDKDNEGKKGLQALGYINNLDASVDKLLEKINNSLTIEELKQKLNENIEKAYKQNDILYFEYNKEGNPIKTTKYSKDRTVSFAVDSGFLEGDKKIYAQYNKSNKGWEGVFFNTERSIRDNLNAYKIGIMSFKTYSEANKFIVDLHNELLPGETWKYKKSQTMIRPKTEYEILESYLDNVTKILRNQNDDPSSLNYNKIRFSQDGKYLLFNTGLLTDRALDILIVAKVYSNDPINKKIVANDPEILTNGNDELTQKKFNTKDGDVGMIKFFDKVSQIVFDADVEIDTKNIDKLEHCISDGIAKKRFSDELLKKYGNTDDKAHLTSNKAHSTDDKAAHLTSLFKSAIERSVQIARRNYKYVVPQYRVKALSIQFLMPIYMSEYMSDNKETPDCVLVLSRKEGTDKDYYTPETVLTLSMAYNNARLICKPDYTWLNPKTITDDADLYEEAIED